jgi:hypothetical protein
MTKQEIFNKVYAHLIAQGNRARAPGRSGLMKCAYRASDGGMCAIGCLIPDELYKRELEEYSVDEPPVLDVLRQAGVLLADENIPFFGALQAAHDGNTSPSDLWTDAMKMFLKEIAFDYDLTAPEEVNE